jgi:hypothetical protein
VARDQEIDVAVVVEVGWDDGDRVRRDVDLRGARDVSECAVAVVS